MDKRLSKDALEAIEEFKSMLRGAGRVEVHAIEESRGGIWGAQFKYFDDTKELVSEETFLTTPRSTRRVAAFIVLFENGNAVDEEWQPLFMPESSKTISEFIAMIIDEDITPSLLTMSAAGLEAVSEEDENEEDDDSCCEEDYPCNECLPDEGECEKCACANCDNECDEDISSECPNDPFKEKEEEEG